jgi:crotonobetainyl-CoA:carnitine CoA-transferase CaiB-like acyl-CoA transferase
MPPPTRRTAQTDEDHAALAAWAASGAMALTGRAGGPPLGPPDRLVSRLTAVADLIRDRSAGLGDEVRLDPLALLGERAAIAGLRRRGATSCGGATRLVRAADGWVAVSLVRPSDVELLPAWLGIDAATDVADTAADADRAETAAGTATWSRVAAEIGRHAAASVAERAWLLGLPVGVLPTEPVTHPTAPAPLAPLPVNATSLGGPAPGPASLAGTTVVDLSSLWAGPLCGSVLRLAGARVVKVESTRRPDGSRRGPSEFFHLLNGGKHGVALDLTSAEGWSTLRRLVTRADVVIEGSRPRALEQAGLHAAQLIAAGGPRVWLSITGHGRTGPGRDRIAFGDDAAVSGGLVAADEHGPCFCADAIADPVTGLVAAAAALDALAAGGRWLLDASLSGVASYLAGPVLLPGPQPRALEPAAPHARPVTATGPQLGEHNDLVFGSLGDG